MLGLKNISLIEQNIALIKNKYWEENILYTTGE